MDMRETPRLLLVAATADLVESEMVGPTELAKVLRADVPPEWPPEALREALPWFAERLTEEPEHVGWYTWYVLLKQDPLVLIGSIGFKGPPEADGQVEIGYALEPQHRGQGLAGEMLAELVDWAFAQEGVGTVFADTPADNEPSCRLLKRAGFRESGPGAEPGTLRFVKASGRSD